MGVQAQSNLTLYNMEPIPQRLSVNPALSPDCKWYMGTPGLSSNDFSFNSNAFSILKIGNSLGTRPNGAYVLNLIRSSEFLDQPTFVHIDMNQEWFNAGFRVRKSMFFLTVLEKVKTNPVGKITYEPLRFEEVIKQVAEKANWKKKPGVNQGFSVYYSHLSYVAQIAEVKVENGKPRVTKVTAVTDCGEVVNLSGAENQVKGACL